MSDRSSLARMAALSRVAQGRTTTRKAREAFDARFERQVDPEGKLDPVERAKRVDAARRAYFIGLSRKAHAK